MKISAKILEEFEKFLVEEDCFSQFCINLLEQLKISFNEYPDYIERNFPITETIYLAPVLINLPFT